MFGLEGNEGYKIGREKGKKIAYKKILILLQKGISAEALQEVLKGLIKNEYNTFHSW
jgi:hypothetical protein